MGKQKEESDKYLKEELRRHKAEGEEHLEKELKKKDEELDRRLLAQDQEHREAMDKLRRDGEAVYAATKQQLDGLTSIVAQLVADKSRSLEGPSIGSNVSGLREIAGGDNGGRQETEARFDVADVPGRQNVRP